MPGSRNCPELLRDPVASGGNAAVAVTAPARRRGSSLGDLEQALLTFAEHVDTHPLEWIDWTHKQWAFLDLVSGCPLSLFRAGNQVGKTMVGAALTIARCLGYDLKTGARLTVPIEAWVVCTSWAQAVAIMGKVWSLVPKDTLARGQTYHPRRGFGKDNPALVFANGSVLRFRTTNQGAEALAGATIDWVWIDEPTDLDIFRELQKRIMRRNGKLIITLTPINRPCEWMHEMVDAAVIREVHAKLDAQALTFRNTNQRMRLADDTPMSDAWIEEMRRVTPPMFVPVVLDGEWETRPQGVFFKNFDPVRHVVGTVKFRQAEGSRIRWYLGIDYAAADRDFGQVAVLSCVLQAPRKTGGHDVFVHVVDEVVMGGTATTDEFVDELLVMLARNGKQWRDLSAVYGDNPVSSRWEQKDNFRTLAAIAQRLRLSKDAILPRILNAKDGPRSSTLMDTGCRFIYELLAMRRLVVHPRCRTLIQGLEQWDYDPKHKFKDVVDGLRYSLKAVIFPYGSNSRQAVVRVAA